MNKWTQGYLLSSFWGRALMHHVLVCCNCLCIVIHCLPLLWLSIVVVAICHCFHTCHHCPSPLPSCHHIAIVMCCCYCCVASSLLNVADGEAVMWWWLADVMMATGWIVAVRKEKEEGWWGLCHDVLINTEGVCLVQLLMWHWHVVAIMDGVCMTRRVWVVDNSSGQWWS